MTRDEAWCYALELLAGQARLHAREEMLPELGFDDACQVTEILGDLQEELENRAGVLGLVRENPAVRDAVASPIARNITAAALSNPRRVLGIETPQQHPTVEPAAGEQEAETETQP
jgi:hypothetical protein